jgi:outer membrane biosynthesis protein TonB
MASVQTATAPAVWYTAQPPTGRRDLTLRLLVAGAPLLLLVSLGLWLSRGWDQTPGQAAVSEAPLATSQPAAASPAPTAVAERAASPTPRLQPVTAPQPAPTSTPAPAAPTAAPMPPTATAAPPTATPQPAPQPTEPPAAQPTAAPAEEPAEEPAVAQAPALQIGANGTVTTGDPKLRLRIRRSPDMGATIIGRIPDGRTLTVIDGPRQADGQVWWKIQYDGMVGWVAGAFVQPGA